MKNIIILLIVLLVAGCHGTKKVTESTAQSTQLSETKEVLNSSDNAKINNNLVIDQKTTTTVIEYFSPAADPAATSSSAGDSNIITVPVQNAVKSITTTTTESITRDQGTAEITSKKQAAKSTIDNSSSTSKTEQKEKPAPDPKRWMWIFGILALITGLLVYLRNSPVVKSVLSVVRKFLKI